MRSEVSWCVTEMFGTSLMMTLTARQMRETLPRQPAQQRGATAVPDYSGCQQMMNDDGVLKQTLTAAYNKQTVTTNTLTCTTYTSSTTTKKSYWNVALVYCKYKLFKCFHLGDWCSYTDSIVISAQNKDGTLNQVRIFDQWPDPTQSLSVAKQIQTMAW